MTLGEFRKATEALADDCLIVGTDELYCSDQAFSGAKPVYITPSASEGSKWVNLEEPSEYYPANAVWLYFDL